MTAKKTAIVKKTAVAKKTVNYNDPQSKMKNENLSICMFRYIHIVKNLHNPVLPKCILF
jgi:hypothetical protein